MKKIILAIVCTIAASSYGQKIITPKSNPIDNFTLVDEKYSFSWYIVQDSIKRKMGEVYTEIQVKGDEINFIVNVKMPQATSPWVDTTIVKTKNFEPIYHSSFNQNRDMVLKYGSKLKGYYLDKKVKEKRVVNEDLPSSIFDSSSYPQLIRWLTYKDGFSAKISIFDYNPNAKIGALYATINSVLTEKMQVNGISVEVWKLNVTDDISDNQVINTYYISKNSRKILKHVIDMNGRKMVMERETP